MLDTGLLDPSEPTCLLAVALLHFMPPETEPERTLSFYVGKLPKDSLVALSHIHVDPADAETLAASKQVSASYRAKANNPAMPRSRADIAAFFEGLELVEPGLVWLPQWRPAGHDPFSGEPMRSRGLAGVGRKR